MAKKKGKKGKKGKKKGGISCPVEITDEMLKPMTPRPADCDECCQCQCDCDCSPEIQPCFIQPTIPDPGPEAYDEFEACLNGSGLTIRVLKNTHKVESVDDGATTGNLGPDDDPCYKRKLEDCPENNCLNDILQRSDFARKHIQRRTCGRIVNHPNIPKVRANIKYSGNDTCETNNYYVPFSKIMEVCEGQEAKVDCYRSQVCDKQEAKIDCYRKRLCGGGLPCILPIPPVQGKRSCCMQVQAQDIKDTMNGVELDTRKKGIEVCYKTCEETDSDVFLVKLGSKSKSQHKKNTIEIELRTPKQPVTLPMSKVTTETYVTEALLDAAKGKGKGKKKGKGKGKKKK
ncbi:uncharacterized protein LOC6581917 [Drosophila mojavensis]|uniref:Uncharacterized protein, isoform A n=1 Tax=Drosophila mojavensis TaxID=7230 RepID=B4L0M9_DROMO|nr:uncharacterized protein LOC6581917 [Drosophila mojavensis]XP_015017635.1 uncharacterized protein LOC6581917 [Drosophila mojavensis]XP_043866331.1 uncharacterized protein LOC6581917 [Drosophila mojavensis]EDW18106.1 uncharacterized protein Dmoj_GI13045, isoform A [Drosophila mojavensis]KRG05982.1 uncharacterized protein Dmoj_GI13045, isoform B [Drosophila mojavensis]KRG05983.1 uncharacterized protein Dmoj_GI13045, isoform C [Drosophila mojavensis]